MKEWALKHPILTFLILDGIIGTIRAFAPGNKTIRVWSTTKTDGDSPEEKEEKEDQEETLQKQIEHKEDTK
jgi:hypothetical protein